MIECNAILRYLSNYLYDKEEEKLIVRFGTNAESAAKTYEQIRELLDIEPDSYENWIFDIAIDCVKNMKPEDMDYINAGHLSTSDYHFGYAMYVRNTYIWHAKKHFSGCADSTSSSVMKIIFTLVNPFYDYRNSRLCDYFGELDFSRLVELYWNEYESLFWEIAEKVKNNSQMTGEEGVKEVKCRIKKSLGNNQFKTIFCDLVKEFVDDKDYKTRKERFERQLRNKALLFPKECNQILAVQNLSIDYKIRCNDLKNVEECKDYIIELLGLQDEDALFIAKCVWDTYSVYSVNV